MKELIEGERRTVRYVSRFPMEPHTRAYRGTAYDLCHSGHPTFHVQPVCCVAPYVGFGVHPHSFDPFYHGHCGRIFDGCHDRIFGHCHEHPFDPYHNHLWGWGVPEDFDPFFMGREGDHLDLPDLDKFRAPVKATEYNNKIKVYFPAEDQHHLGTYKLVIVAQIYEPGYAPNNLRTITMDYKEVFTIVGSSDEADAYSSVEISVGNNKSATDIVVTGTQAVGVGQTGKLVATVIPYDIDEGGVTWSIDAQYAQYLSIVSSTDNSCVIIGRSLNDSESSRQVVLKVASRKNPEVYKNVTITIMRDTVNDIYTTAGEYQNNNMTGNNKKEYINLTLTDGSNVQIDTTKETVWYEGD